MRESLDGFGASKRPLTDVKEEPQERDEDLGMIQRVESPEQCKCTLPSYDPFIGALQLQIFRAYMSDLNHRWLQ